MKDGTTYPREINNENCFVQKENELSLSRDHSNL